MAAYIPRQGDIIAITFDRNQDMNKKAGDLLLSEVLSILDACIY
jgi:hypothetical protein